MPRGVKGSGPAKKPARKSAKAKPAAKPKLAVAQAPSPPLPPEAEKPIVAAAPVAHERPLGSVDVDSLSGEALKAYARRAGVFPRDIDYLTEDRLRQNTKLTIADHFELLSEA